MSNTVLSKLPANLNQKTVAEHSSGKCRVTSAPGDTTGAVGWKRADIYDRDLSDSEELDSKYEVIVIT